MAKDLIESSSAARNQWQANSLPTAPCFNCSPIISAMAASRVYRLKSSQD